MARVALASRRPSAGRPRALRLGFHLAPGMKVGLYGGSFNPAHQGHTHVALTAKRRLGLDRVIWLVSPQNPLKTGKASDSLVGRMAGATSLAGGSAMVVSDAERRLGAVYTIDTLRLLKARFPSVHFVWIMGADSLADLARWRDWPGIFKEVPVAVVARPGATLASLLGTPARRFAPARLPGSAGRRLAMSRPPAWIYLTARWNRASSTALRNSPDRTPRS